MATQAQVETFIAAFQGVARADWNADPVGFIAANNRLFDAMCGQVGYARASDLGDDELREAAAVRYAAILSDGDR